MPSEAEEEGNRGYWRRKLAAYLHDSPEKVLSIFDHESRARRIAGEDWQPDERSRKEADWAASAADRLPFPPSRDTATPLTCFRHPLGGKTVPLNEADLPIGAAEEISQKSRPALVDEDPRRTFFATWRLWRNWASTQHPDFALYPAETRLPDHTIWNHLAVTSAMQGCLGGSLQSWIDDKKAGRPASTPDRPCFLLFTIGPVQDFIAAARSTRDLWSGSYLLSYLVARTLARVALDFGPDHVIFPNLCDQPLVDLLLKEEIWDQAETSDGRSLSDSFGFFAPESKPRLLTPTLPNRFLAVLPAEMVEHRDRGERFASPQAYAADLAKSLRTFLKKELAVQVSKAAAEALGDRFDSGRFATQVEDLLEIHWQVLPWPEDFAGAEALAASLPPDSDEFEYTPRAGLTAVRHLCGHGADGRYLSGGLPKSVASAWSALYSATDWLLDGAKAPRAFRARRGVDLETGRKNTKDSLNGRDEAVLVVRDRDDAEALSAALEKRLRKGKLLKEGEALAASTLVKRLWPFAFLAREHDFAPSDFAMPNTRSVAAGQPWAESDDDEAPDSDERYFAILALDGDSMGRWIGGGKLPPLAEVLSDECRAAYETAGADLAAHRRPLSPSWHLQFSEALGSFSLHAARRVVEAFDGRLIYSGGDDVLAMLPADRALLCAEALRLAFRGDPALNEKACGLPDRSAKRREDWRSDRKTPLFAVETPGFLQLAENRATRLGAEAGLLEDPVRFPAIVPGPEADCSVGIAIAHFKSPLQDVVKAAQTAEKRAKKAKGKATVAVSLFKRSGEISEWQARWESGGLALYGRIAERLEERQLTGRFPHRVCQLLEPHLDRTSSLGRRTDALSTEQATELISREFANAVERQSAPGKSRENMAELLPLLETYLSNLLQAEAPEASEAPEAEAESGSDSAVQRLLRSIVGLCTTVAFAHRTRSDADRTPAERQAAP